MIQINEAGSAQTSRSGTRTLGDCRYSLIRAVRLPRQMQLFRSRDASQFQSDGEKDRRPVAERVRLSHQVDAFFFLVDNLVLLEPSSPKQYPSRRSHKRNEPDQRKPQQYFVPAHDRVLPDVNSVSNAVELSPQYLSKHPIKSCYFAPITRAFSPKFGTSRGPPDDRNWFGLIPVILLNACVKEPNSRYPNNHAISEIGIARSLR